MTSALNEHSLDQSFRSARTSDAWTDPPVEEDTVGKICDLMKWGPASANRSPARFVWMRSTIGHELDFAGRLPRLMPHAAEVMQEYFAAPGLAEVTAMRNGTLRWA